MAELHHECGVAAVHHAAGGEHSALLPKPGDPLSASRLVPRMLLDMQNRGQLAAGMSTFHPDRGFLIETYKQLGTVAEAFRMNRRIKFESLMERLDGSAGIGHVRYATCGLEDRSDAQPFERTHGRKSKWFAFAFNGQLANYQSLRREFLIKGDYHLQRDTDTEIIMHAVSQELADEGPSPDWARLFGRLAERFDGAYNIVLLSAHGEIVVVRDPLGVRPLATAQDGPLFAAASESVPLSNLGFENVRSLEPGTLAVASDQGVRYERFAPARTSAHCFFEWIYFANVASNLDDRSVYLSRAALGRELAALETVPPGPDLVVVPVPDTAKAAADAMAYALELPSVEGLMRNRYVGRTFIESGDNRQSKVRAKYTPLPEVLSGKRVLLVEDSIVRSTTLRALVQEMRKKGGAREIHLRIASPPIIAPCFYGIDMSTRDELIAPKYADLPNGELSAEAQDRLARELGADSLRYLPVEALARSIGLAPNRLCLACVTGQYPTPTGQALFQRQLDEIVTIEPKVATPKLHENGAANGHGHAREENGHTAENGNAGTQPRHDPQSAPARAYERPT